MYFMYVWRKSNNNGDHRGNLGPQEFEIPGTNPTGWGLERLKSQTFNLIFLHLLEIK